MACNGHKRGEVIYLAEKFVFFEMMREPMSAHDIWVRHSLRFWEREEVKCGIRLRWPISVGYVEQEGGFIVISETQVLEVLDEAKSVCEMAA